jgi:hypothetical protein
VHWEVLLKSEIRFHAIGLAFATFTACAQNPAPAPPADVPPANAPSPDPAPVASSRTVDPVIPVTTTYEPLTGEQRFDFYVQQTYSSPGAYLRTLVPAINGQIRNRPYEWGQGSIGFARRTGSAFTRFMLFDAFEAGGSAALGYEVRYVRCHCTGFFPRFGYAVASTVVTRDRHGHLVPDISRVGAAFGSEYVAQLWYPPSYRDDDVVLRGVALKFVFRSLMYTYREFTPEIDHMIHHH